MRSRGRGRSLVLAQTPPQMRAGHVPLPLGDDLRRQPDMTKARKMLDWEAKVGLDQGLPRTAEWFSKPGVQ